MCVATVYVESGGELKELMSEVIRIDVEGHRLRLVNLFGQDEYIQGVLKSIDFWEEHSVIVQPSK